VHAGDSDVELVGRIALGDERSVALALTLASCGGVAVGELVAGQVCSLWSSGLLVRFLHFRN
jgi:hypothetical protein